MAKQLANAREKIERTQQHIEDKRLASQQAIERLEKEYQNMAIERRDTDKHNEELRAEADEIERKVSRDSHPPMSNLCNTLILASFYLPCPDDRSSQT
jgi:hypothetical protein